ncbi:hypothetical protein IW262DRAFT_1344145 [Armillaria fumosa]|nr:hypothetical protein IW262DRAFT_1344145 [Armillaria fumosa]
MDLETFGRAQAKWGNEVRCHLAIVLRNIGFTAADTDLNTLTSLEGIQRLLHYLPLLANSSIMDEVMASTRLELIQGRVERTSSGRVTSDPLVFRSYLLLRIPAHRTALTRLLTSNHTLAVERGRWLRVDGTSEIVPRAFRVCRCCHEDVEDELHVLFLCSAATLQDIRMDFLADVWRAYPGLRHRSTSPKERLHALLTYSDLLPRLGRYVHEILDHVEQFPMYIPMGTTPHL